MARPIYSVVQAFVSTSLNRLDAVYTARLIVNLSSSYIEGCVSKGDHIYLFRIKMVLEIDLLDVLFVVS